MPSTKKRTKRSTNLKLTKAELEHLRDIMSVMAVKDRNKTLSVLLAEHKGTKNHESKLWKKVEEACQELDIEIGEQAPDYLVGVVNNPEIAMVTLPSMES